MNITPATEPVNMTAGDQPTTCTKDGVRTVWHGPGVEGGEPYQIEICPLCKTLYHVYEPDEEQEEYA